MNTTVKIVSDADGIVTIGGYGVVFGGADLYGEQFTKDTDFWFDRLTEAPMVLYQHGMDTSVKTVVIGRVTTKNVDDIGLWIEAQIDKAKDYAAAVLELVQKGVLGWSSGAVSHLVEVTGKGQIKSWPVAEFSLTPNPAEPRTLGVSVLAEAAKATTPESSVDGLVTDDPGTRIYLPHDAKNISGDFTSGQWIIGPAYTGGGYVVTTDSTAVTSATTTSAPAATKAVDRPYEQLIDELRTAINRAVQGPFGGPMYAHIEATYPDHVVVEVENWDTGECTYYSFPYTIDEAGAVTLGQPVEVQETYVPVAPAEQSIAALSYDISQRIAAAVESTKGYHERRVKEGRQLSDRNRASLQKLLEAMSGAMGDLQSLLESTAPVQAEADAGKSIDLALELELLQLWREAHAA